MNKRQAKKKFKWQAGWTYNQRKIYQELKFLIDEGITFDILIKARLEESGYQ